MDHPIAHRFSYRTIRLAVTLSTVVLSLALAVSRSAAQDAAPSPIGVWATEGAKSHVKIADCGGGQLCGSIIWLEEPQDKGGKDKVDSENPDPAMRTRKILGLALLNGFAHDGASNVWTGGTIYNPNDGKTYSCKMTLQDPKTLRVRGYVGLSLLGKTQIWNRVQ
jgi:uncharacterized protein (DUF2147 family)